MGENSHKYWLAIPFVNIQNYFLEDLQGVTWQQGPVSSAQIREGFQNISIAKIDTIDDKARKLTYLWANIFN